MPALTFLFTDIVGSTRLWEAHPQAMPHALETHDEVIRKEVEAFGGNVFKHSGDGALAAFPSAADALNAAAGIQMRMQAVSHPDIGFLSLRMAVHTGEVEERDGDYYGPPLNRTSRLMSVAHGGQVLVSLVTERLAAAGLGSSLRLEDLGSYRLRDLARPEQVFQLNVKGLPQEFPPLSTPDLVPNNLPTQPTSFVGRDQDLGEVTKLIRGARLVTITGVGGAGKTRLALQAAADVGPEFPDGVWLVELAAITDPELIEDSVADALGVAQGADRDVRKELMDHLSEADTLIVLDNCEHLVNGAADFVNDVLTHTAKVRFVVTSRELLGVSGEVAFGLRSMTMPSDSDDPTGSDMLRHDAVRLFLERAQAAKPDFHLTGKTAPAVAEICRRLDGMPLALELAAARLRSFSPQQVASNLDHRFRLLTGGSRTALPRQQTLAAAIDWSYRLLDDAERRLFERLSVFQGGFTLGAVSEVCTDEELEEFEIWELLPALVDKSLVAADVDAEEARYRLLETLRQFARDILDESGRADEFRHRHALFYRDLALEAGNHIRGTDEAIWWSRIDTELDNLRQAMVWSMESGHPELALETAAGFWRFWWFKSRWSEGVSWLERALAVTDDDVSKLLRATGTLGLGSLLEGTERHLEAIELLREAIRMFTELEEEGVGKEVLMHNYAATFINLSVAMERAGSDPREIAELNRQALEVARRVGDSAGVAVALGNLAESAAIEGDVDEARQRFEEALAASAALGSNQRLMDQHFQIGLFELAQESFDRARKAFQQALELAEEARMPTYELRCRVQLPLCDVDDDLSGSVERFDLAVAEVLDNPDLRSIPFVLQTLICARAELNSRSGDLRQAAVLLGASRAREERGSAQDMTHKTRLERVERLTRSGLGEGEWEGAFEEGRNLDTPAVIEMISGNG